MATAMPIVALSLAAEMMYVLKQRLDAGKVAAEKKTKVLCDIISAVFNGEFLEELFRPQPLYSWDAMLSVFNGLAHSSIMKLSTTSMSKLFDLMTMAVKRQAMSVAAPEDLLLVALNHVAALAEMAAPGPRIVRAQLDAACTRLIDAYAPSRCTHGEWQRVHQAICALLHPRRVQVALFLREQLQAPSGLLFLPQRDVMRPRHADAPIAGGAAARAQRFEEGDVASAAYRARRCRFGRNLYDERVLSEVRRELRECSQGGGVVERDAAAAAASAAAAERDAAAAATERGGVFGGGASSSDHARAELSMLAQLLGSAATKIARDAAPLKIDLGREIAADPIFGGSGSAGGGAENAAPVVMRIDRGATHAASKAEMMSKFGLDSDSADEEMGGASRRGGWGGGRRSRGVSSKGEGGGRRGEGFLGAPESESDDDLLAMMDG